MRRHRLLAASTILLLALPLSALSAEAAPALPATFPWPKWAVGFYWTYHYEGATNQEVAGFRASSMNDTYTSSVIGEASTARGEAWVVRNTHAGTMSGKAPGNLSGDAVFTSLSFYYYRKSDYAVLNFTQDIDFVAQIQFVGTVTGRAHNDSFADPPLSQVAFGSPANGMTWRVATNITSTGWYQIDPFPPANVSSYLALDYNLSVNNTENAIVPAGTLAAYNITGGGTADFNGTVYNFTERFLWAPSAMSKAVDEAGYDLTAFFVNRPPAATGLPPLPVPSGNSNTLNLNAYFIDPEGDPFTIGCVPAAPLSCSVAPNGTLTVTADTDTNGSFGLNLTSDDGLPGGNATAQLTVLVSGPGNPNQPPTLIGNTTLTTPEDEPYTFVFASHISDPDDSVLNSTLVLTTRITMPAFITFENETWFVIATPANFTGSVPFYIDAYDSGGNFVAFVFTLAVIAVNDPPDVRPVGSANLVVHTGDPFVAAVAVFDAEDDAVAVNWTFDGANVGAGLSVTLNLTGVAGGDHFLNATGRDPLGGEGVATFFVTVLTGPVITSALPQPPVVVLIGSTVEFRVVATDADSPVLQYTWSRNGTTVGQSSSMTSFTASFATGGTTLIRVTVTDGNTSTSFQWAVVAEVVPLGLASIESPARGAQFPANTSVNLSAAVDPRLSNVSIEWRLDGVLLASAFNVATAQLPPGNHTVTLHVEGLYNGSAPYTDDLSVSFLVLPPATANNTTGGGGPGTEPLSTSNPLPTYVAVLAAAFLAVIITWLLWRRRRREPA